jgi:UDP-N-acetylmuramate-alanine ligase
LILTDLLSVRKINTFSETAGLIPQIAGPKDLVLTMGGGNICQCAGMIISKLKNPKA